MIPRDNIPDPQDTAVCVGHWSKHYPTITYYWKYVPVTHTHCLTALNQVYLLLLCIYRKNVRALSKTRNTSPYELHLFEQKKRIRDIENTPAISDLLWYEQYYFYWVGIQGKTNYSVNTFSGITCRFIIWINFTMVLNAAVTCYPKI